MLSKLKGKVKGGKGKPEKGARGSGIWLLKPSVVGIPTTGSIDETYGRYCGSIPVATMGNYKGARRGNPRSLEGR
jgi:hypothetical protein